MSRISTHGPFRYIARSWATLIGASLVTLAGRALRGPLVPGWAIDFEIGVRFWRAQFNHVFAMPDIVEARRYFDSLQTWTDEVYDVERRHVSGGDWIAPRQGARATTLLYLHGGGYALHAGVTRSYAEMLATHLRARMLAPDYRLTPEHPHPAQVEDALAAYRGLLAEGVGPGTLVLVGDSAGGHLVLMLLVALREAGLPQPALAVGLCPWTDIGERGASLYGNDAFDVVQGYMAVQFGRWLVGATDATREALSPIHKDYAGLAPIYLQGGGREGLIDMIRDLARVLQAQGCEATLDVWPQMMHDFQSHGLMHPDSAQALARVDAAIAAYAEDGPPFTACGETETISRASIAGTQGRTDDENSPL